jgi:hypothetical protein
LFGITTKTAGNRFHRKEARRSPGVCNVVVVKAAVSWAARWTARRDGYQAPRPLPESVNLIAVRYQATGDAMDTWLQILLGIILFGIAIELAYIGRAIGVTNKRLSALLKHINP